MLRKRLRPTRETRVIAYEQCLAKTFTDSTGRVVPGRTVLDHCQIVGEVARALLARYPKALRETIFPNGAVMVAASHDIGKVSPCFAEKLRRACTPGTCDLPPLEQVNPFQERLWGGHAGVSQVAAEAMGAPKYVPEILGQHHGYTPVGAEMLRADDDVLGGTAWQHQREALVATLRARLDADWPDLTSVAQARALAGLTSVADWIGSGEFFEEPSACWQKSIELAVDNAGFVTPELRHGLSFEQIFGFPPNEAQRRLVEAIPGPGVYVLEAPMGIGKTEAALYAAYQMLTAGIATGFYFALPTQLTSNKIHARVSSFLDQVLTSECTHRSLLLHSSAWLLETEMGEEGRPGGAWFNQAKRGLLAPFAVGTIDQALMAVMNVKHGFVRAFGLTGKVVILDEVHTYDAYTGALLDALVELLQELGCTVIILSATLARNRRERLTQSKLEEDRYPLITTAPDQGRPTEIAVAPAPPKPVRVRLVNSDSEAIETALQRAADGQQVLWIENTVPEAQQRYLDIAARANELGIGAGLLHSRFIAADRQRHEDNWVSVFGKEGWPQRVAAGRLLVGTQVLEQSLDIDADFLVSRFAPSDMILQRMGRLWRHEATPRSPKAHRETWLIAPPLDSAVHTPERAFGSSAFVYSPYVLCRSLEAWQDLTSVTLPHDIRGLIETTYASRVEEGPMARWLHQLEEGTRNRTGTNAMQQLARVALARGGRTLPEVKAQTRYSEQDTCEVLLLKGLVREPRQESTRITLLCGDELMLPWRRHHYSRRQWRETSASLMRQMVPVRLRDAPLPLHIEMLRKFGLHHCFYLGDIEHDEALLRIALVDELGGLRGVDGATVHDKYSLSYRDDLGYRILPQQGVRL